MNGQANERSVNEVDTATFHKTISVLLCTFFLGACGAGNDPSMNTDATGGQTVTTTVLGAATPDSEAGENARLQAGNQAPTIVDTSYRCDPVAESVAFEVGQSDAFTLSVTDEFPLTLDYAADSSNEDSVSVSVDDSGVFTINALRVGESWVWLTATDSEGLADEYELHVVVQ